MGAHVLLNLLNELGKSDKIFGDKDSCRRKIKCMFQFTRKYIEDLT